MNITGGSKREDVPRRSQHRGVSDLVAAQLTGIVGGLMLAVDGLVTPHPKRYKIIDRDLTRC